MLNKFTIIRSFVLFVCLFGLVNISNGQKTISYPNTTLIAASYALSNNRLAIPAATDIGTNATYAISYADGAYQVFGFSSTNDLTLTLTGPGTGNRAYSEVTFTNYTYRAVTWPTNNATWVNTEPTGSWARVAIDWVDMNGTVEAALINTTPTGE